MEIVAVIIALIVPIGVAIWTVRCSAKDTANQIVALEESTTKQIESIKELASGGSRNQKGITNSILSLLRNYKPLSRPLW